MTMAVPRYLGPQWDWGDRLRKIRRAVAHMSQSEMAAVVGVKPPTYSAWEGGRNEPSIKIARLVASRLEQRFPGQVSAAWVLGAGSDSVAPDSESQAWLPRMDSNHEPPDCGFHRRNVLRRLTFEFPMIFPHVTAGDPRHKMREVCCAFSDMQVNTRPYTRTQGMKGSHPARRWGQQSRGRT